MSSLVLEGYEQERSRPGMMLLPSVLKLLTTMSRTSSLLPLPSQGKLLEAQPQLWNTKHSEEVEKLLDSWSEAYNFVVNLYLGT